MLTCKALWVDEELEWFCKPTTRTAGGLLLIWRRNLITLEECFQGSHFNGIRGFWGSDRVEVGIINVYAPCDTRGRREMWN